MTPAARNSTRRTLPRLPAAVLALFVSLSASACGIPATGVVEAGEPATGVLEPGEAVPAETTSPAVPADTVLVYFLRDGSLVPVTRTVVSPAEPGHALRLLFEGPDDREQEEGLTTELRPAPAAEMPTVRADGAAVTIELPASVGELSDTATDQLACTAAAARLHQDPDLEAAQVTVEQPGGRLAGRSSDHCPGARAAAEPRNEPTTEPTTAASVPAVR